MGNLEHDGEEFGSEESGFDLASLRVLARILVCRGCRILVVAIQGPSRSHPKIFGASITEAPFTSATNPPSTIIGSAQICQLQWMTPGTTLLPGCLALFKDIWPERPTLIVNGGDILINE